MQLDERSHGPDIRRRGEQFDASRRGKKTLNYSRDKNQGAYRSVEEGGGPAM